MKNAFSVFVFGGYESFLPFYISSINQNYNNLDIVIFYHEKLSFKIQNYIEVYDNVIIYDNFNFNNKIEWLQDLKIKGGGPKTLLRFLIKGDYFKKYRYVYFGDVDVLIFKESISLFDFHESQIKFSKVPFSNKVRLDEEGSLTKRLTGLHFVEVRPYYEKIDPIINKIFSNKTFRNEVLSGVIRDEELLFNLCEIAFNFDSKQISENKTPLHGLHLGLFRHKKSPKMSHLEQNSFKSTIIKYQLNELNFKSEFDKLLVKFYCKEVFRSYKYFYSKISYNAIFVHNYKFTIKYISHLFYRIKNKIQFS
jgi:hypothetical protein